MKLQKKFRRLLAYGQGKEILRRTAFAHGRKRDVAVPAPSRTRFIVYNNDLLQKSLRDFSLRHAALLAMQNEGERRIAAARRHGETLPKARAEPVSMNAPLAALAQGSSSQKPSRKKQKVDTRVSRLQSQQTARNVRQNTIARHAADSDSLFHVLSFVDVMQPFFQGALQVQRSDAIFFEVQRTVLEVHSSLVSATSASTWSWRTAASRCQLCVSIVGRFHVVISPETIDTATLNRLQVTLVERDWLHDGFKI